MAEAAGAAEGTIETPEQAMLHLTAHRVLGLARGMTIASLLAAALVMVLEGDPFAARVHASALAASAVLTGAYSIIYRDPRRYNNPVAFAVLMSTIPVMLTGYYYWGMFSAYVAVVPVTIFIAIDAADTPRQGLYGVAIAVVAQTAFGLATVFGWIESRGLVEPLPERSSLTTELVAVGLIQMMTIGAAVFGNEMRMRTTEIINEHAKALRVLAQREAQVVEAQAEAVEARKAGGGAPGRFTQQVIAGFTLGDVLGRGAMGEVYAATRNSDGAPCAIKLLAPHLLRNSSAYDRFQRESAILAALDSPHVVKVLAVSTASAALPFVAMERLSGIDLAQLLKQRPQLPLADVAEIVSQVARGLDAAHQGGVIHRDLKPQNLFAVGTEGFRTWKLIDFGVARWADSEGSLTKDTIVGTPGYMSPEQALGHVVDARSDIYALGVIVYRMVALVPAVMMGEVPKMLHEVVYKMPVRPSKVTDVPAQVEAVLAIALAKQPGDRFQTGDALARAFEVAIAGRLPRTLHERADRLLARTPWGKWVTR